MASQQAYFQDVLFGMKKALARADDGKKRLATRAGSMWDHANSPCDSLRL